VRLGAAAKVNKCWRDAVKTGIVIRLVSLLPLPSNI